MRAPKLNLEHIVTFVNDRQPLVGFSIMIQKQPLEELLDWKVLAHAYTDVHRLLFARAVAEVLDYEFTNTMTVTGSRTIKTDAVVLEPIFTGIVVGILGVISVVTMV